MNTFSSDELWLHVSNLEKSFAMKPGIFHTISLKLLSKFKRAHSSKRISVFSNINLDVHKGECIGIHGPNGSGKTTLLRCIANVMSASSGTLEHRGETTALLTHGYGAYEDIPIWRNILLTQQLFGLEKTAALKNINPIAEAAGIKDRLLHGTSQLSEGMRAKIALVSLNYTPFDLLLIDESLNHVDAEFRTWFYERTREWLKAGRSLILTSHDPALLKHFSTRILKITNGSLQEDTTIK